MGNLELGLLAYLALGVLVAYANDALVVGEHTGGWLERANYFVRATLAWPSYLVEDAVLLGGKNGSEDEEG